VDHTYQRLPEPVALHPHRENGGLSRRDLLRYTTLAAGLGLASLPLAFSSCESANTPHPHPTLPVRRDITTPAAQQDIDTFKSAIIRMQQLPKTDPRNWTNQAAIHLNHCRHDSWLLFPWHTAYLYCLEEICRDLTGNPLFALPYWNWTTSPQIPAVFWDTTSPLYYNPAPNPPYIGPRLATARSIASSTSVGSTVINSMLDETNFLVFAGAAVPLNDTAIFGPGAGLLEETPHNYIHGFVGGTMGAFLSPLDPIFWTHHCRIDQLWTEWYLVRNHPLTNDSAWWDTQFTEFCDGQGNPVTITVEDAAYFPLDAYRYDETTQ
jgi:tyrosinase